ncbi:MAG: molybdate ABC transporter substrate-binding protein, partial [Cyclobacteriaceae bacterium]|nr:molybdate ABC transporter substrate-binding protein [Cyclobacteriaceae bacterium]
MISFQKINLILLLLLFSISGMISCRQSSENKTLVLYCAAGIKPPVEKLVKDYEKISGVQIEIQYGGSGTLLSGLRIAQSGDLYLAADESYLKEASKLGLITETGPLAYLSPVIAVKKGNPKNITGIEDFLKEDISFSLGNPEAASVGKFTKEILESRGLWKSVKEVVTVFKPTVNEVANDIRIGAVDAGIIWNATANQYETLEIVNAELFDGFTKQVTIGVLSSSENPTEALGFLRYLSSREFGNPAFSANGYEPVPGDIWEVEPSILFFSGGVNRVAIEN